MICRHCQTKKANRPLGLCWDCYYCAGVRELYPSTSKYTGKGEPPEPVAECHPTQAIPGTAAKVKVMVERAEAGQPIFHPQDATLNGVDPSTLLNRIARRRQRK